MSYRHEGGGARWWRASTSRPWPSNREPPQGAHPEGSDHDHRSILRRRIMTTGQSRIWRLAPPIGGRDHTLGPPDAPVTLLEYGDYQCPHCGEAFQILKQIYRRVGHAVRFAFRHFPLAEIHPLALRAAEAAEAAGAQGKFWEMHTMLCENQHALAQPDL